MITNGKRIASTPILLVSPNGKIGGAERALLGLARSLPASGFHPTVVLLQPGPLEDCLRDEGCATVRLNPHRTRQVVHTAQTVYALRALIRSTGARVVVSNMWKGHFFGGIAARTAGVPAVFWQQGIPTPGLLERLASSIPAKVIVCSCDAAIEAQMAATPHRRVCKIHLGIRTSDVLSSRGKGSEIRQSLGWVHNPIVGIVGRLEPWKGQAVFLQAAALLSSLHPRARFMVVGGAILGWEGSYPDDLERLAAELGLAGRVHFAGHQHDVYPWYDALDVAVHASFDEPFGLVLIEAMALGRPLVATAAGGPLEIVEDGVSGLLVPPGDPEKLASAVDRVLGNGDLASSLERGAAQRATVFSEQRMAERFAELLQDLIAT